MASAIEDYDGSLKLIGKLGDPLPKPGQRKLPAQVIEERISA
jgi:hypothetical protein